MKHSKTFVKLLKRALLASFLFPGSVLAEEVITPQLKSAAYENSAKIRMETVLGELKQQLNSGTGSGSEASVIPKTDKVLDKKAVETQKSDFEQARADLGKQFVQTQDEISEWKEAHLKQMEEWKVEHGKYVQRIPEYKKVLIPFSFPKTSSSPFTKSPMSTPAGDFIIQHAFSPPIKDQGARGTCSAFAAIRSFEILLAQNRVSADLSEQYFYWKTRPDCQTDKCIVDGGWILNGFKAAGKGPTDYLKTEAQCPYIPRTIQGNATQTPLAATCMGKGAVGTKDFEKVQGIGELYTAIEAGAPVVIATTLSENFYTTKGLIFLADAGGSGKKLDSHASGHALVAVGYLALPPRHHRKEGKRCILVANSWSAGWGVGGYGCVSESWLEYYGFLAHSVAPTKLTLLPK